MSESVKTKQVTKKTRKPETKAINSKDFPSYEEMQEGLNEVEKMAEEVKKDTANNSVTIDNWYVPFGKYKKLLGKSVLNIVGQDKKSNEIPEGRRYLAWMLELSYLDTRSKQIISQLLSMK